MKIGIQVSSFRPVLKTEEQLRTACARMKAMGCDVVQLQWIDPGIPPETVASALKEWEIKSVSVQDFFTEVQENFAYYSRLNHLTAGVHVCVSRIPEDWKTPEGLDIYAEKLRDMASRLLPMGQKLCFHPVSGDFARKGDLDPVEALLERMPELEICADLYHLHKSGRDIHKWLKTYSGRVFMVHFKDFRTFSDGREELVPAGQGEIDWTGVVQTCLETGVAYAFVEQERWLGDPFERLEEALVWLRKQVE